MKTEIDLKTTVSEMRLFESVEQGKGQGKARQGKARLCRARESKRVESQKKLMPKIRGDRSD